MPQAWESGPGRGHVAITPNDVTEFKPPLRAVVVGSDGTVVLTDEYGVDVSYPVLKGQRIDLTVSKVKSTGTTGGIVLIGHY
jgi:hypothetical protein